MTQIPIYVVSLTRSLDRRAAMTRTLGEAGFDFSFFDATDGMVLGSAWQQLYRGGEDALDRREEAAMNRWAQHSTPGIAGCSDSHIRLWQHLQSSTGWALVLEDDADIAAEDRLREVMDWLASDQVPDDVRMLQLCGVKGGGSVKYRIGDTSLGSLKLRNRGPSTAMAIHADAARVLLGHVYPLCCAIDTYIHNVRLHGIKAWCVSPEVCRPQEHVLSTLGADQSRRPPSLHVKWHRFSRVKRDVVGWLQPWKSTPP